MNKCFYSAIKTFISAFLGVLIPEACAMLTGALPNDIHAFTAILIPILCASLSAGIRALWLFLEPMLDDEY